MFGIRELREDVEHLARILEERFESLEGRFDKIEMDLKDVKLLQSSIRNDFKVFKMDREELVEQKIPENCDRLNKMLLDLKGIVCQYHASFPKDQNKFAVKIANEAVYSIANTLESKFILLQKYVEAVDTFMRHVEKNQACKAKKKCCADKIIKVKKENS